MIRDDKSSPIAKLALENGAVFSGYSIGASGQTSGEVCFNTSMTGYQEVITDPSYCGQIVTMTYPQIGNYGVNEQDVESARPRLAGFVVKELNRSASNFRSSGNLQDYLEQHHIVGIAGIDTRALVRKIRQRGALRGVISTVELDDERLVAMARDCPTLKGRDLVKEVVPTESTEWNQPYKPLSDGQTDSPGTHAAEPDFHVVVLDFGMKWNIARHLSRLGCKVTIVPGNLSADEILQHQPHGILLSNGPGDPEPLTYAIKTIQTLMSERPVFGICLGHQLLALASGAKTFKLKFGHRGSNQPVLNCVTGRVEITSQNHGFAVDEASLPVELEITHRNLHDNTIAGLRHRSLPAFGVQYHPEASAGPHDSQYLFAQFLDKLTVGCS